MSITTRPQPPDAGRHEHDDLPFVQGLLARGADAAGRIITRGVRALDRRMVLWLWGSITIATFLAILVAGLAVASHITDILTAVFVACFFALVVAAAGAWVVMGAFVTTRARAVNRTDLTPLEGLLAPVLRELDAVRAEIVNKVKVRSVTRVPAGMAVAGLLWLVQRTGDEPAGLFDLAVLLVIGAVAGELWASHALGKEYVRLYKSRVLPGLAKRFGNLTYRVASPADFDALAQYRVMADFDTVEAEDELVGTYRGLPLRITEAKLTRRSGKQKQTPFDGLLIELVLPRPLTGTTVVRADQGAFGNLAARLRSSALERVRLEDPRFERKYEVYGSDQIEARALLTPAFMERFTALASGAGFSPPAALVQGNRLTAALPKRLMGDLFEPPPYWKPAGGAEALQSLSRDIEAVLKMADEIIDLDFWSRHAPLPAEARNAPGAASSRTTSS
jgi:hypothetical protein